MLLICLGRFRYRPVAMEAHAKSVKAILHSGDQYLVPFFQRHYAWKKPHWQRLLDDLLDLIDDGETSQHFLGPLVCTPFHPTPGNVTPFQIIDGQQRLTTLTIALAALRDVSQDSRLKEEITEDYLIHKRREDLQRYKVVPRLEDRSAYQHIIDASGGTPRGNGINDAYAFFKKAWVDQLRDHGPDRARRILSALTDRMSLVTITITGENPYEIFESLNSTGEPLEEADLIRNYLFMLVPMPDQDRFHERVWASFERSVSRLTDGAGTPFYRNYLMRGGAYSRKGSTFVTFKELHRKSELSPEERVSDLQRSLTCYGWLIKPETAPATRLQDALRKVDLLDVTTAYPLLLVLLERVRDHRLTEAAAIECLNDFSSFVLRRSICGDTTRSYGRWFAEATRHIGEDAKRTLSQYWLERGWPDDATFGTRLQDFAIYKREPRKAQLMLEGLEQSLSRKEVVDFSDLQIEHILPQTIRDDDKAWQTSLGPNWKGIHERRLHTLPNLTLSGYNPELSNRPFGEKKIEYARSNLRLTRELAEFADWNESFIRARGERLAVAAINLWHRPAEGGPYTPVSDLGLSDQLPLEVERGSTPDGKYIIVHIDWSDSGRSLAPETICESVVARTMAKFISRLVAVLGEDAAAKLCRLRISRGPMLSRDPARDFRNTSTGKPFGHQSVPGTPYFVLTHSGTSEKLGQMRQAADILGLSGHAVTINLTNDLPAELDY